MNIATFISSIKKDLTTSYNIPWSIEKTEFGEGDVNFEITPDSNSSDFLPIIKLYLSYTRFVFEFGIRNQPILVMPVFEKLRENVIDYGETISLFEKLFLKQNGSLIYYINNESVINKPLSKFSDRKWLSFSLRYESGFAEVLNRFDINYLSFSRELIDFSGLILTIFNFYQKENDCLHEEGEAYLSTSIRYERNPINRELCLRSKGYACSVCGLDMRDMYGKIANQFIEVHHSIPISEYGGVRQINPQKELFPVCPNCHAMLHRKNPPYSIDELKQIIKEQREKHNGNCC